MPVITRAIVILLRIHDRQVALARAAEADRDWCSARAHRRVAAVVDEIIRQLWASSSNNA